MKALFKQVTIYTLSAIFVCLVFGLRAGDDTYYTVSGVIKDKVNNKGLQYVNIAVAGTNIGTVTNEDGTFSIKVKTSVKNGKVELSHVGYGNLTIAVSGTDILNETYYLTPESAKLNEVIVKSWEDPRKLIEGALDKIEKNYSDQPTMITGFYRETAQKRRTYVSVSEAIVNIYKTSYKDQTPYSDKVQIFKGRQLMNQRGDTLSVKLMGGPNLSIYMDVVKNPNVLFDKETLSDYTFMMAMPEMIDERLQYVVNFEPQAVLPYPLFFGKVFIDQETLSFTRLEFSLDMKDRNKATDVILKRKPAGLRFKPEELSFLVTYKQREGKSYLNYIRNEIKFKCDWKKRLFATGYTVVSEMVATENKEDNVENISRKETFRQNESLSDMVKGFYDEDFWGSYNIIEPTESLESAVNKLRKQYK